MQFVNDSTTQKLSIQFRLYKSDMLEKYPKIEYNIDIFVYEIYGGIRIDINGKSLENFDGSQCITDDHYVEEYLWFFYLDILESVINLINKNNLIIGFADSTNSIKLQCVDKYILFTFSYGSDIKSNIENVPLLKNQYIEEVIRSSSEFIDALIDINPNILESEEIKKLVEKFRCVETAYKKSKE